jgi:hypothetical protein
MRFSCKKNLVNTGIHCTEILLSGRHCVLLRMGFIRTVYTHSEYRPAEKANPFATRVAVCHAMKLQILQ